MSTRYRAAFFDVGETLVYAHPSPAEIMAGICAESGLDVGVSRIEAAESVVGPRILQKQAGQAPHELYSISRENSERFWLWVYDEILGALEIPPARRPALAGRFHERFSTLETWRLFPDAVPTLEVLQERRRGDGLVVGVVSNWEDWLETLLIRLEIDRYFDFLIVSAGVGLEKPHPGIFRAALERAGTRPEATLHVGDSLHADVGGARRAGITPVLLDRRQRYGAGIGDGVTVIRTLEELPPLLT